MKIKLLLLVLTIHITSLFAAHQGSGNLGIISPTTTGTIPTMTAPAARTPTTSGSNPIAAWTDTKSNALVQPSQNYSNDRYSVDKKINSDFKKSPQAVNWK